MSKSKKQVVKKNRDQNSFKWEELMDLRDMTVAALISQQTQLHALSIKHKEDISNNADLAKVIGGLALTYKDVADATRNTMNKHMELDDNNTILSYKKGIIKDGTDDFYTYINISREYISQAENIATYASTAFTDIFTQLKTYDMGKFEEEILKGKEEMTKIRLGAVNGN